MPSTGSTSARGYGYRHQQLRERCRPTVEAGRATCWRCGLPIAPNAKWDLGHSEDRTRYMGPEHIGRECPAGGNRATNGRRPPPPTTDTSRDW